MTPPDEYVHKAWAITDGLPQSSVTDIIQTRDGYLWVATFGGLARFDGVRFTVFDVATAPGLGSNRLTALHEDAQGILWIGSEEGLLTRYEGGHFSTLGPQDSLPVNTVVWDLMDDQEGALWIATDRGLLRYTGDQLRVFTAVDGIGANSATALAIDTDGRLWVATGLGIAGHRSGSFDLYAFPGASQPIFIQALIAGREGGLLWMQDGILGSFERGRYEVWKEPEIPTADPLGLLEDRDGNLWFASRGLQRLNGPPGRRSVQRVLAAHVRVLLEDRDGNLWIGTNKSGLHMLRDSAFTNVAHPSGSSAVVITESRSREILIGFGCQGLWSWSGEELSQVESHGEIEGCVTALLEDRKGRLWVGTHQLLRREGGTWSTFTAAHGLPENSPVQALYEDRHGRIWLGLHRGLGRFDDDRITVFTTADGLAGDNVRFITEDRRGDLWIGGPNGVTRYVGGNPGPAAARRYTVDDGLPHGCVRAIHEAPDENLWIGTYGGGLAHFNRERKTFSFVTSRDGLIENVVSRILEDDAGHLWLSGNRGITRLERAEAEGFLNGELDRVAAILYDEAAGMAVGETNGGFQPAGWRARDGKLWFPTIGGAVAIDPDRLRSGAPPPVAIEIVRVERREVVPRERVLISPGNRDLEIEYVGVQLGLPHEVAFRYRLVGYDRDWVEVGNRRTAYYTGLDPGIYRFEVTAAAHRGGPWNPQLATLEVEVEPFMWETLWFRAGVVVVALALIVGGVGWRSASLRNAELEAINAEMERFVHTVSHDLKSPLVTIQGFLGFLVKDLEAGASDRVASDIEQIGTAARTMQRLLTDLYELARVGLVANPSQELDLGELAREAIQLASGRIAERGVGVTIAPHMPRVVGDRVRILEVMQNLVENAVKYMGDQSAPRIEIDGVGHGREVICRVRDNGVGIDASNRETVFDLFAQLDPNTEGTGIGLALVKKIVEVHGGRIWVESDGRGCGSTFCFTLPRTPLPRSRTG